MSVSLVNMLGLRRTTDLTDSLRIQLTLFMSVFFGTFSLLIALLVAVLISQGGSSTTDVVLLSVFLSAVFSVILNVSAAVLSQSNRWRRGAVLFGVYFVLSGVITAIGGTNSVLILVPVLPLIYLGLVFGTRVMLAVFGLFTLLLLVNVGLRSGGTNMFSPPDFFVNPAFGSMLAVVFLFILSVVMALIIQEQVRLRSYTSRLYAQLRATAEVAQTTSTILELDELLRQTVDYIRDRFGFYHVQIFLIDDERRYAELVASTGEVGQELLERGHRLAVGSQSVIGRVTLTGEPTITLDTEDDPGHRRNELLTETRSELALPLITGDKLIGALDVQSTRPNAYSQEDIDSLSIMATQVSIAIRNAQLFEEQKRALNENRRLFLEAETNLREIERLNQRLTGGAWGEYLREYSASTLGITLQNNELRDDISWTPGLSQAIERRRPVATSQDNRHLVAVPVELRGQILGAIELEVVENLRQADLMEMVQAVATRLALSIDNARLFEEAQSAAQQELDLNAISAKMQGMTDIDDLLRGVVADLGRALNADHAAVRLGLVQTASQLSKLPETGDLSGKSNPVRNGSRP